MTNSDGTILKFLLDIHVFGYMNSRQLPGKLTGRSQCPLVTSPVAIPQTLNLWNLGVIATIREEPSQLAHWQGISDGYIDAAPYTWLRMCYCHGLHFHYAYAFYHTGFPRPVTWLSFYDLKTSTVIDSSAACCFWLSLMQLTAFNYFAFWKMLASHWQN